jgi:hypothetical protein
MRLLTALFASCLSLTAIAAEEVVVIEENPQIEMPALSEQVVLEIAISWPENTKPLLEGLTNLPDGTLLEIHTEPEVLTGDASEVTVKDQTFSVNLGGENGLDVGEYSVAVNMLLPMSQPDEVKAVIGENGENINGNVSTEAMIFAIEAEK